MASEIGADSLSSLADKYEFSLVQPFLFRALTFGLLPVSMVRICSDLVLKKEIQAWELLFAL